MHEEKIMCLAVYLAPKRISQKLNINMALLLWKHGQPTMVSNLMLTFICLHFKDVAHLKPQLYGCGTHLSMLLLRY